MKRRYLGFAWGVRSRVTGIVVLNRDFLWGKEPDFIGIVVLNGDFSLGEEPDFIGFSRSHLGGL
ncbi:hypothetical protein CK510_25630 [Brunnivagina elsteri CCALA 953]|uniref:Uncharacterized protein n=1 Tax=Brunnivagina elsteri CCALA 953 TaxID=987040 RepID=A0A2A2TC09_9CYAN|nr:hypothetical protein CK510_25630 [Calothrix elsteri CCALA 953]